MTDRNEKLAAGLAKIGLVLRHHAWARVGESGLNPTQGQLLVVLRAGGPTGLPVSTLAESLAVSAATVSASVSALERKGLVTKQRATDDARVVRVMLTDRGRSAAERSAQWPDLLLQAIDTLDEQERAVFVRGLIKMIRSLQEAGAIPVSRMCPSCVYFRPHAHQGSQTPHHCNYVDAPLGDADLRIDCAEHEPVEAALTGKLWQLFVEGQPLVETGSGDRARPLEDTR